MLLHRREIKRKIEPITKNNDESEARELLLKKMVWLGISGLLLSV